MSRWHKWWNETSPRGSRHRAPCSRRAFLGGGAAVLTLPFLESIAGKAAHATTASSATRCIWFYVPNGMMMADWIPTQTGPGYDLPRILASLAPIQDEVMVISNLANRPAQVPVAGDHARGTGSFLTCETVELTAGDDIYNGTSIDQIAAQQMGDQTLFPSLELGTEGGAPVGDCDSGYSCAYSRNISWSSPTTPTAKVTDPVLVFDRLFAGFDQSLTEEERDRRLRWRTSILDNVLGEATTLRGRLSTSDRSKLDEYMNGVRALEQRLSSGLGGECIPGDRPADGVDFQTEVQLMSDLMVKAMECDLTRVITFMMENAGSNRSFDFLGISGAHHELSHHQGDFATTEQLVTIGAWEVEQYANLIQTMHGITEDNGLSMLDNSLVFFSSEIADGDGHHHTDLPVLLAGRGGGLVNPGRHLALSDETPIANLYLAMVETLGVVQPSFGDSTGSLDLS